MFWTAVFLQDKLSCAAVYLSVDFLAQRLRGRVCQLVMAAWKSLINSLFPPPLASFGAYWGQSVTFPFPVFYLTVLFRAPPQDHWIDEGSKGGRGEREIVRLMEARTSRCEKNTASGQPPGQPCLKGGLAQETGL